MSAHPEALAATGHVGPVEEVEVGLLEFGEADQAVDRAESGAEVEGTRLLLLDNDIEVLASGDEGVLRRHVDLGEVVEVHQARLAHINKRGVEDPARLNGEFAADDLVLGLGVPLDVDQVHIRLNSLVDAVGEVDLSLAGGGDLGLGRHVDITARSVEIADHLEVSTHSLWGVERAFLHLEEAGQLGGLHDRGPLDGELVDAVLRPLGDGDHEVDPLAVGERLGLDLGDPHVCEAPVLVKRADSLLVLVHLRGSEAAGLGQEGKDVGGLCLHHLEQILRKDRVVSGETDAANDELRPLVHDEDHPHPLVGEFRAFDIHLHVGVVAVLIELEDLLTVLVKASLAEGVARLGGDLLADLRGGDHLRALDQDLPDGGAALEQDGDLESAGDGFGKDAGVGDVPRGVE